MLLIVYKDIWAYVDDSINQDSIILVNGESHPRFKILEIYKDPFIDPHIKGLEFYKRKILRVGTELNKDNVIRIIDDYFL